MDGMMSQAVLGFLINSIWQVALAAGVAAIASRLLRRAPARYQHALWVIALLFAIALPIAGVHATGNSRRPAALGERASALISATAPGVSLHAGRYADYTLPSGARGRVKAAFWPLGAHRSIAFPPFIATLLLALYFVFIAYRLARLGKSWLLARAIRASASAAGVSPAVFAAGDTCRVELGLASTVRILISSRVSGPVTLGVRNPVVILPHALALSADHGELAAALAHEFAHVARRDYSVNLVYELISIPVSFHPAAAFLKRRIGETRELACDEIAARILSPSAYARSLVRMAHRVSRLAPAAANHATLGVFDADILEERIMRLLDKRKRPSLPLSKVYLTFCCLLLAACCLAASGFALNVNGAAKRSDSLSGIVVDAGGARVPHARVWLMSRETGHTRKPVLTDAVGKFSFTGLTDGKYTLEVMSPGFSTEFRSFTFKSAAPAPFFPFILQTGAVQQSVVITAKAPPGLLAERAPKRTPVRIRIGGEVEAAKLIQGGLPEYPAAARGKGIQGMVLLEAVISKSGIPLSLKVLSSPSQELSGAALKAVKNWRYRPTLLNGNPVEVVTTISVVFRLEA